MARAQGCVGIGPVHDAAGLKAALAQAMDAVLAGQPVVVDVRVAPGYGTDMQTALTRGAPGETSPTETSPQRPRPPETSPAETSPKKTSAHG